MKKYFYSFVKEEEGIETIEFIALLAVAAVLIGIVTAIGTKLSTAGTAIESQIDGALSGLPK